MSKEVQAVTTKAIGYSFNVSIEREIRTETESKYPDKTVVKASLGGHADTFDAATSLLEGAAKTVKEQIEKLEGAK